MSLTLDFDVHVNGVKIERDRLTIRKCFFNSVIVIVIYVLIKLRVVTRSSGGEWVENENSGFS
jgi:hypothetical protein